MIIPRIMSGMIKSQPDQTSDVINRAIDEVNRLTAKVEELEARIEELEP